MLKTPLTFVLNGNIIYGLPFETCASACELSRQQQAVCTVQQMFKTTKEQISLSSYLSLIVE